jgi:3-deoxy-D-manno-oct-2-ulosonic acid (Kdo) hydroxylase
VSLESEQEALSMAASESRSTSLGNDECKPLPVRLEQGEIVCFPKCPFALPNQTEMQFLLEQRVLGSAGNHIVYDPVSSEVHHAASADRAATAQLAEILKAHTRRATAWLAELLPRYAKAWQVGSSTLRPEEEATRRLRFSQREDLLHVDPFPEGGSRGRRLLRLFVNLNPVEPRVWATSEGLGRLLERFGETVGLPAHEQSSWTWQVRQGVMQLLDSRQRGRTATDDFRLRLATFLKANDHFQEKGPKRFWHFAQGSAWLVMTDGLSHAVLRGRHASEMSFFIEPSTLACPELEPSRVIELYGKKAGVRRAA